MKKIILSIVAVAALVALPMGVKAEDVNTGVKQTQEITAKAKIVTPLKLSAVDANLDFGTIAQGTSESKVTLAASSVGKSSVTGGDATALDAASSKSHAASFKIEGEPSATYTITLPTSTEAAPTSLSGVGTISGTVSMYNIVSNMGATPSLPSGGSDNIYVGADITISASAHGSFSVDFPIVVAYN